MSDWLFGGSFFQGGHLAITGEPLVMAALAPCA